MCLKITKLQHFVPGAIPSTHWGRVMYICICNLTIIGSDNGLSPGRRKAIIWTNVGILIIGSLGTHFSEILIEIHRFYSRKCIWICRLRMAAIFSQPRCVKDATSSIPIIRFHAITGLIWPFTHLYFIFMGHDSLWVKLVQLPQQKNMAFFYEKLHVLKHHVVPPANEFIYT